ncbi:hypothetical protein Aperf_G00000116357 [Anoplocephala perfoliata]
MFLVGLTGGIASGKSTVSDLLRSKDVPVIDADVIARDLVDNDRQVQRSILKAFGPSVFSEDGSKVEREKLGLIVFSDPDKRKILNSIVHPLVFRRIAGKIFRYFFEGQSFVVLDIPLLFEARTMLWFVSDIIVVNCSPEVQLSRLLKRNPDLTKEAAVARIEAQLPLATKAARATIVIDNERDNGFESLNEQVENCLVRLRKKSRTRSKWIAGICICFIVSAAILLYYLYF